MDYLLVLQFSASNDKDYDELMSLEVAIEKVLEPHHEVDGHDFGVGEMNLFIYTNEPEIALVLSQRAISRTNRKEYIAAYRGISGEVYKVIFPKPYAGDFNIK